MKNNVSNDTEQELIRFFIAGKAYKEKNNMPVFMPACIVDEIWHELLNEEERYNALTFSCVGVNIEHHPNKGSGEIGWVEIYDQMFGKLSKQWFTTTDGKFNSLAYEEYLEKGKFYAAWDCTPGYVPQSGEKRECSEQKIFQEVMR